MEGSEQGRRPHPSRSDHDGVAGHQPRSLVLGAALVCVLAQVAVRGWALYGSWFYLDDYVLIGQAEQHGLSWHYLLTPYNDHLMPGGRLLASGLAAVGDLPWWLAATTVLAVQALAGLAALWALVVLFGQRWAVLAPLNLFLWTALTVPAMMWLASALVLVPLELSFWLAVGCWVTYLRSPSVRWLALTVAAVALGLCFDVKAVLTVGVLAFITLAWFSSGAPLQRVRRGVVAYWPAALVVGAATSAYLALYLTRTTSPLVGTSARGLGDLAGRMVGTGFGPTAVGGPWRWSAQPVPTVRTAPPVWAQDLSWVVIAGVVAVCWLTRTRTLRAWALLVSYLVVLLVVVATSRGATLGPLLGGELRFLNDAGPVLALCVGLAVLPLRGAVESSAARERPLLILDVRRPAVALLVVVCVGSLVSTVRYVHVWHTDNASRAWIGHLRDDLRTTGPVDLADTAAPDAVIPRIFAPHNGVGVIAPLASDDVSFPSVSPALLVVGDDGHLRTADIQLGVRSLPGPRTGCGWLVTGGDEGAVDIPLSGRAFPWTWWLRIGYLTDTDSPVTVVADDSRVDTVITSGLNNLYVRVEGAFSSVRIEGLDPGASMCVDTIEVGQPVAGGVLG